MKKKLLKYLFNYLHTKPSFHKWSTERIEAINRGVIANDKQDCALIEVVGGGYIRIAKDSNSQCGWVTGFSFGVSWGRHGFHGGVLSRQEAKLLSDIILIQLDKLTANENETTTQG